jgi:hypothetical protein
MGKVVATTMAVTLACLAACGPKGATEEVVSNPFERIYGSPEQNRRREIRLQKKVRECMVLLGWEYTPVDPGSFTYTDADAARDREEYGYGISTYIGNEDAGFGFSGPQPQTDPNQNYVQTLSEGEQTAYYEDLYGRYDESAEDVFDPSTASGCQNEAYRQVYGNDLFADPDIQDDLNKVYEATVDDARMAKAQKKWSKCMGDKGYDYATQDEIYTDLQERVNALTGGDSGGFSEFAPATVVSGDTVPFDEFGGDGGGFDDGGGAPAPSYDTKKLAELQALERAIAVRDHECTQQYLAPVQAEINTEAIDALLAQHPELDKG